MSPAASVSCALGHPSLPQGAGESSLKGFRFMLLKHHFPEDVPPRAHRPLTHNKELLKSVGRDRGAQRGGEGA